MIEEGLPVSELQPGDLTGVTELTQPDEPSPAIKRHLFSAYPSPTLLLLGGIIFLAGGAVLLRTDLVLLGLIPFAIVGYAYLAERRLISGMRIKPLRGVAWPPVDHARVGIPITIPVELENRLPFSLGILRMEIRTCPGLASQGRVVKKLGQSSKLRFDLTLLPTRPGPAFFYGLSVIITTPLGFRPRRYYLLLPISLMVSPPLPSTTRSRRGKDLKLYDRRPIPSFDGDFAYLRDYIPGDPFKAVVKAASLKKRKPIVRLSYPMKKEKWALLIDMSPALFRGLPGFAPFDSIAAVLPFVIKKLKKYEHEVAMLLYREEVLEFLPKVRYTEVVSHISKYRYLSSDAAVRMPEELLRRLSTHLAWNFGISVRFPDSLEGSFKEAVHKQLQEILRNIPRPKGLGTERFGDGSLTDTILELAYITGLELPVTNENPPSLASAIDMAIAKGVQNIIIFSEHEPFGDHRLLLPRLLFAAKRGISVRFMLLDTNFELIRPFGKQLLERKAHYRWDGLLPALRSVKARTTFWNPSFPETVHQLFHTD